MCIWRNILFIQTEIKQDVTAGISRIASRFLLPLPVLGERRPCAESLMRDICSLSGETVTAPFFCSEGLKTEFLGAEVPSARTLVLEEALTG